MGQPLLPRWEVMENMATDMQNDAKDMRQFAESMYETSLFTKQKAEKLLLRANKMHVIATSLRGTEQGEVLI